MCRAESKEVIERKSEDCERGKAQTVNESNS